MAWVLTVLFLSGCGTSSTVVQAPSGEANAGFVAPEIEASDPMERARAGGWTAGSLEPPPHYCNDEGGTEWCEGEHDDDCDGIVDEGCADCVNQSCVRHAISAEEMSGASRTEAGVCIGPVYCGRTDGYASTEPPGGCGAFHCGTLLYGDGTARPYYCTIYGRCVEGEFIPKGFSW